MTLKDVPDEELERIAGLGFDWVWLLSVRQTGEASRRLAQPSGLREAFGEMLPDLTEDDICESGFAITCYTASKALGGVSPGEDYAGALAEDAVRVAPFEHELEPLLPEIPSSESDHKLAGTPRSLALLTRPAALDPRVDDAAMVEQVFTSARHHALVRELSDRSLVLRQT